jgi:hypothetical protein
MITVALKSDNLFLANVNALNQEIATSEGAYRKLSPGNGFSGLGTIAKLIHYMASGEVDQRPGANDLCSEILSVKSFACSECQSQFP